MLHSGNSFVTSRGCKFPSHFLTEKGIKSTAIFAKKQEFSQKSNTKKKSIGKFEVSSKIIAQSAIVVLSLGFVDAGYSGDWSRIGVISRETENLLNLAAFVVLPLSFFLIFRISRNNSQDQ